MPYLLTTIFLALSNSAERTDASEGSADFPAICPVDVANIPVVVLVPLVAPAADVSLPVVVTTVTGVPPVPVLVAGFAPGLLSAVFTVVLVGCTTESEVSALMPALSNCFFSSGVNFCTPSILEASVPVPLVSELLTILYLWCQNC